MVLPTLTKAQLKALMPTRRHPGLAKYPSPRMVKTLRGRLVRNGHLELALGLHQQGLEADPSGELHSLTRAAMELLEGLSMEAIHEAPRDTLAVAERILVHTNIEITLTDAIVATRGLVDAVRVKRRALSYTVLQPNGYGGPRHVAAGRGFDVWPLWDPLRAAAAVAELAEYSEARQEARVGWKASPWAERMRLAYAFPDAGWGDKLYAEQLGEGASVRPLGIVLSSCSPDVIRDYAVQAKGVLHQVLPGQAMTLAMMLSENDFLEIYGPLLDEMLSVRSPPYKTPPREVAAALMALGTERTAEALARHAGHPVLKLFGARGWSRDSGGFIAAFHKPIATKSGGQAEARVGISPGIEMGFLDREPRDLDDAVITRQGTPIDLDELDPVQLSELALDLKSVRAEL